MAKARRGISIGNFVIELAAGWSGWLVELATLADDLTDDDADDIIYIKHHFTINFNLHQGVIMIIH